MKTSRVLVFVGALIAGAGLGAALAAAPPTGGAGCPPASAALVTEGSTLFSDSGTCFTCHGSNGVGSPLAPELMASRAPGSSSMDRMGRLQI